MTYLSVKESLYHADRAALVAFVVPHGADAADFLRAFPEIARDPALEACWPLFESYLNIERDIGAGELAHSLASSLARLHSIPSLVVEINYPRGIIDGGRLLDHCLRHCLPNSLFVQLRHDFLAIHQQTLDYFPNLYKRLRQQPKYALIDVHTMASFCPADAHGVRSTLPISFPRLQNYVDQFLNAREHAYQRCLDLITEDEHGQRLADDHLFQLLRESLEKEDYPYAVNEPYRVSPGFLSYQHLKNVPGISIDVPKHFIASWREDLSDYELNAVNLDVEKIEKLAHCLTKAIGRTLLNERS